MAITNPEEYYNYIKSNWDIRTEQAESYIRGFTTDPLYKHQENINAMIGTKPLEILKQYNVLDKVVEVNLEQALEMYVTSKDDETYKQLIKENLSRYLADVCMKKATFTQIKTDGNREWNGNSFYDSDKVRIIGRCVILSIDEFAEILMRPRG